MLLSASRPGRLTLTVAALLAAQAAAGRPAVADEDAWRFRAAAYGWAPSMSGNLTARGQTVDVNASFIQILQKSDSLIGFMGYFEADKGPVGFYADLVWAKLGFAAANASLRNPIAGLTLSTSSNTAVTFSMTIVEAGGLYEFARWSGSAGSFTALDGLAGFRYWNNAIDFAYDLDATADFTRLSNLLGRDVQLSRSFAVARSAAPSGSIPWSACACATSSRPARRSGCAAMSAASACRTASNGRRSASTATPGSSPATSSRR